MSDPNWVSGFGVPPVLFVRALCIDSQVALSQSTPPLISRYCHRKGILCCAADVYTFCVRCRLCHLFSTSTHIPAIHLPAAGQELITTRPGKSRLKQKPELAFKSKGKAESARKMVYFDQSVPPSDKRVAEEALRSTGHQACQFLDRHVTLLITCHKVSCIYIYICMYYDSWQLHLLASCDAAASLFVSHLLFRFWRLDWCVFFLLGS